MVRIVTIALTAVVVFACGRAFSVEHTKDSPETVKKVLGENKAILIDVREQAEWDAGHLQGAQLLPLSTLKGNDIKDLLKDLPKDKPIYLHCKAGGRCLQAAEILQKQGFDARALKQGYRDLLEAGFKRASK
jgi:phage shock protein E